MENAPVGLKFAELTEKIIGVFYDVYNELGYEAQLLHYPRATEIEVGLLLNFGIRPQFRRLIFDNERKKIGEHPCESVARVS